MAGVVDQVPELLCSWGFPEGDVILLGGAGSTMHGVGVGSRDDLDRVAVGVEPLAELATELNVTSMR